MATESLAEYVHRQLTDLSGLSLENALTIVNYVLTQKTEVNIADTYRLNIISTLIVLSKFLNHKPFKDMTEDDILLYLDSLRKPEASDTLHKGLEHIMKNVNDLSSSSGGFTILTRWLRIGKHLSL